MFRTKPELAAKGSLNVLIIDHCNVVRKGIAAILRDSEQSCSAITELHDIGQFPDIMGNTVPQIVMISQESISAEFILQFFRSAKKKYPMTKIILYGQRVDLKIVANFGKYGLEGYITGNFDTIEMQECLSRVLSGKVYVSNDALIRYFQRSVTTQKPRRPELSPLEEVVAEYLVNGRSVTWISKHMSRHTSTISSVKKNIFKKMRVTNIIELAREVNHLADKEEFA